MITLQVGDMALSKAGNSSVIRVTRLVGDLDRFAGKTLGDGEFAHVGVRLCVSLRRTSKPCPSLPEGGGA